MMAPMPLTAPPLPRLTSLGHNLDLSDHAFGWFRDSRPLLDDPTALRHRFAEDGYLFLTQVLDPNSVDAARLRLLEQLHELGQLQPGAPVADGIARTPWQPQSVHTLIHANEPLQKLLYSGPMLDLHGLLFDAAIRHFDFTWIRAIGPGRGTAPHADAVYMNRGTRRLVTTWTPLMEIPLDIGGLLVMPGSHRVERLRKYFAADVDTYCENRPPKKSEDVHNWIGPLGDGKLSENPPLLQKGLGLPWLTAETYRPGDVVIFSLQTLHASLDNTSNRVRLSTDSRYQPADEPADPRWIGPNPTGHSPSNRRAMIC
jgi:hypothetical protein